jgi:long-chain fatty acid transport protein
MRRSLVCSLVLLIVLGSSAIAQDEELLELQIRVLGLVNSESFAVGHPLSRDFNGAGARAMGMGKAFIGVSDDVSAVSWNPAGLYQKDNPYEQPVLGFGANRFSSTGEFHNGIELSGRVVDQQFDSDDVFNGFSLVSFLAPLRIKGHPFVGSISYTRMNDEFYNGGFSFDTVYSYTFEDRELGIADPFNAHYTTAYHSGVYTINFGFGTRLYDRMSMGLSVNVYAGKAESQQSFTYTLDGIEVGLGQRSLLIIDSSVVDTISYSGVYLAGGLRYGGERFSAGLVIKAPHALKQTRDRTLNMRMTMNGLETTEGTETFHFDDELTELDQPLVVAAGVGYRLTEKLLVAADAEYRAFSSGEVRVRDSLRLVPGDRDTEFYTVIDPNWNDVLAFRTGAEYLWHTGSTILPVVPVRAGFGYTPIPEPDIMKLDNDGAETASTAITSFSFGTGARWEQIHLDFAYVISSLDREDQILDYSSSNDNHTFSMMFTGYF